MNYVESFNLLGVEAKQIPCIKGDGAPIASTQAEVGMLYMDTSTGIIYKCISSVDGVYEWNAIADDKFGNFFETSDNQFNVKEHLLVGKSYRNTGELISYSGYSSTPLMPVLEGYSKVRSNYRAYKIVLFDADKKVIKFLADGLYAMELGTAAYYAITFVDAKVNYDNLMILFTNDGVGQYNDASSMVPYTPYYVLSKSVKTKNSNSVLTYDEFLSLVDKPNILYCSVGTNAAGIKEATFTGITEEYTHIYIPFNCDPTKVAVLEFYGQSTSVGFSSDGSSGAFLTIEFFDENNEVIGTTYNGYVLGESRCGYHKYGYISPLGTKSARLKVVTRANTNITLHSLNVSIKESVPTRDRVGVLYDAHLGMILTSPKNTLISFEMAKKAGFSTCVTNCNWTSDGVLVALHDDTIDATSNGTGNVHELTFDQLQEYDFGSWFNAAYTGTSIPKLEDVVKFMATAGIVPIFRLYNNWTTDEAKPYLEQIHQWIIKYGLKGVAVCKSFNKNVLSRCYEVMGDDVSYIFCDGLYSSAVNYCSSFSGDITIEGDAYAITSEQIEYANNANVPVSAYNANNPARIRELINMGVTRFCTDAFSDMIFPMS